VTVFTQLEILHKHVTNECFKTFAKFSIDAKLGEKKKEIDKKEDAKLFGL
jgi:hypothetical protein